MYISTFASSPEGHQMDGSFCVTDTAIHVRPQVTFGQSHNRPSGPYNTPALISASTSDRPSRSGLTTSAPAT